MAAVNPPAWMQAGSYPARNDRLGAISGHLYYAGFSIDEATPLRPRAGVRPSYQNYQLKVRAAATPNMTVIVSAGFAWVDNHDLAGYGTYTMVNDGDVTLSIAPAGGAGQYRKDTVGFTAYDAETAGSVSECRLEVVQGPYASSAGATVRGTIPPNMVVLADVSVAPSQTSIAAGNIADVRLYTVGLGGICPIPSANAPNHPAPGQMWYQPDVDTFRYGKTDGSAGTIYPNQRYQQGTANVTWTSGTSGSWVQVDVTFPTPFATTPIVHVTPQNSAPGGTTTLMYQATGVTTTGFTIAAFRSTAVTQSFGWTAFQ